MGLLKIRGAIQHYAWGGKEFIPNLIDQPATGEKFAEYWMGAHDKAPSTVHNTGEKLNDFINRAPEDILGARVFEQFGRLPYLFKVLDVSDMLSIQVHPTKNEAEIGFEKENLAGISLSAPHRNYKDDNHKPEIMVALDEFWLLHGFKPADLLVHSLSETPELTHLLPVFEENGYQGLYQTVMEEPNTQTNSVLSPLIKRILPLYKSGKLPKESPEFWASRAFLTFCPEGDIDKGIYSIFFFNIVKVNAGEALFQDAGVPHAYMEGQNMELMANSDNVLRGGLTPKHVDVEELLNHVSFSETIPNILQGELQADGIERVYFSPAPDFELSKLDFRKDDVYASLSDSFEILIVMNGKVTVTCDQESINLTKGEVFAVTANTEYKVQTTGNSQLYKARCPEFLTP